MQICFHTSRCPCGSYCDELKQLTVIVDHFFYERDYSNKYVIRLHPKLSVTHVQNQRGNKYASGVVTLQFAVKMLSATPKFIYYDHPPNLLVLGVKVYAILLSSIKDGNSIYKANYKDEKKCLSAEDLTLLNSDLQIHLKEEFDVVDELTYDMVASYIMNLEKDQILLFIRMQDYNVWSVIERQTDCVVIYDSQPHSILDQVTGERKTFGGAIYHVLKRSWAIMQTLRLIELNSGLFQGLCKIGIIERCGDVQEEVHL